MHYKRVMRHGSPDYRWGGRVVGRPCQHCERPVAAKELCDRHYQMLRKHGDALYADKRKKDAFPAGTHIKQGYRMVTPSSEIPAAAPAVDPSIERHHKPHAAATRCNRGLRDGSERSRRQWEHRKIAGAKKGEIVHHIDGDRTNNERVNLHIFPSPREHVLAHRSLERCAYQLLATGQVVFDPIQGIYRLSPTGEISILGPE